jgi:hypothetical protein
MRKTAAKSLFSQKLKKKDQLYEIERSEAYGKFING